MHQHSMQHSAMPAEGWGSGRWAAAVCRLCWVAWRCRITTQGSRQPLLVVSAHHYRQLQAQQPVSSCALPAWMLQCLHGGRALRCHGVLRCEPDLVCRGNPQLGCQCGCHCGAVITRQQPKLLWHTPLNLLNLFIVNRDKCDLKPAGQGQAMNGVCMRANCFIVFLHICLLYWQ